MWTFLLFVVIIVTLVLFWGQGLDRVRAAWKADLARQREPRIGEQVPATHMAAPPPTVPPVQVTVEGKSVAEWLDEEEARTPHPGERVPRRPSLDHGADERS